MRCWMLLVLLLAFLMPEINFVECRNDIAKLSRRKRYVAFPEGATLSLAICLSTALVSRAPRIFTESVNWGFTYELPNKTSPLLYSHKTHAMRHRRELYQKMETIIDAMGMRGRDCICRTLCETAATFKDNQHTFVEKLLHTVFKFPYSNLIDDDGAAAYFSAYKLGMDNDAMICYEKFPLCSISLLAMMVGYN